MNAFPDTAPAGAGPDRRRVDQPLNPTSRVLKLRTLVGVRVFGKMEQRPSSTLFAVYTSRQYITPRLRSFIDFMSEALAEAPPPPR